MKKTVKTLTAIVLSIAIIFSATVGTSALSKEEIMPDIANAITVGLNTAADFLLKVISTILPATVKVKNPSKFESENFYEGNSNFIDEPAENAKWKLGYASESILPEDYKQGKYYKGGYDINKKLTECIDDLRVRVMVIDDQSGRGKSVFAVVDCIGLANADVRKIRAALSDFAKENNIISINISSTHTHSGIDTQGIYTDTFGHVFKNLFSAMVFSDNLAEPIDTDFLDNIIAKTAYCVKKATADMKEGTLTFAKYAADEYVRDRTDPDIMIDYIYRLKFNPDDNSKGTIITNIGVHPESMGWGTEVFTSDFIYYTEQVVNEAGYNFMFIQGAVGTYTEKHDAACDGIEGLDGIESAIRYGEEIGYILLGMTETEEYCIENIVDEERENIAKDSENYTLWCENWVPAEEKVVEPVLNIRLVEYFAPIENGVYRAFGKLSLANNTMCRDIFGNITSPTEIGYMELGKDIKIILCPGETYAELIVGGGKMDGFVYKSAYEIMADENDEILVFDLMNDALGYIMPDNDFALFRVKSDEDGLSFADGWGLTSIGKHAASDIYGEVYSLYNNMRGNK